MYDDMKAFFFLGGVLALGMTAPQPLPFKLGALMHMAEPRVHAAGAASLFGRSSKVVARNTSLFSCLFHISLYTLWTSSTKSSCRPSSATWPSLSTITLSVWDSVEAKWSGTVRMSAFRKFGKWYTERSNSYQHPQQCASDEQCVS